MKTLVVYYTKTGTTKTVAEAVIAGKNCDYDELRYDEKDKTINYSRDPSDYEHVILLSPIWAFTLAEPMKQYISKHNSNIKNNKRYDLLVTCSGLGLRGCVKYCVSTIGKPPENALKFRSSHVKRGVFDISAVL